MNYLKNIKKISFLLIPILLFVGTVQAGVLTAPIHFVDTSWDLYDQNGYDSIEVDIKPEVDESTPTEAYYFSNFISFTSYSGNNLGGGYAGFQTNGYSGSSWIGKMAIFSIWDVANSGVPEPGGYSTEFGGEGTGHSVRIPFDWQTGRTYRLKMYLDTDSATGNRLWGASLTDISTGVTSRIGRIYVPASRGKITSPITFHEIYLSQVNSCSEIRKSQVRFTNMTANNGVIKATGWNHYVKHQSTTCPGVNWVTDVENGFISGVGTTRVEYQSTSTSTNTTANNSQATQQPATTTNLTTNTTANNSQATQQPAISPDVQDLVTPKDTPESAKNDSGIIEADSNPENLPLSKSIESNSRTSINSFTVWAAIITLALTIASVSLFIARKLLNRRKKTQVPIYPGPY